MAIDLLCGQCEGHLLAEEPGSIVACPHCGAHLQVPGDPIGAQSPEEASPELATAEFSAETEAALVVAVEEPSPLLTLAESSPVGEALTASAVESPALANPPLNSTPLIPLTPGEPRNEASTPPTYAATQSATTAPVLAPNVPQAEPIGMPSVEDSGPETVAMVPRTWFFLVASYASVVTLAFLFLLMLFSNVRSHQLESLPDVVPKIQNGEVGLEVAPPEANVAQGHVLPVGESRRFGSVRVTPVRITQGPLRFEHVLNDPTAVRPPSEPVLKLWLKFENVSWNQTFTPLDPLLLFKRHYQAFGKSALTNQFLCQVRERKSTGDLRYLFEMSPTSEFRISGQNLNTVLAPGDSVEMFVPSEDRVDDLTGDLVWRVQFRKGYHARSMHGVTTLIDVPFKRSDVKQES